MNNLNTGVNSVFNFPMKLLSQVILASPPAELLAASEHFLTRLASQDNPFALNVSSNLSTCLVSSQSTPIISNTNNVPASSLHLPNRLSNFHNSKSTREILSEEPFDRFLSASRVPSWISFIVIRFCPRSRHGSWRFDNTMESFSPKSSTKSRIITLKPASKVGEFNSSFTRFFMGVTPRGNSLSLESTLLSNFSVYLDWSRAIPKPPWSAPPASTVPNLVATYWL
mmetsp:Transcript_5656/g.8689  ORF Transcript_5656/g.8689 Transcript_5656/m.8689 type:complete len:226 (+) Transcript_5656:579-1256(+)